VKNLPAGRVPSRYRRPAKFAIDDPLILDSHQLPIKLGIADFAAQK